jgi:hypothetical protein
MPAAKSRLLVWAAWIGTAWIAAAAAERFVPARALLFRERTWRSRARAVRGPPEGQLGWRSPLPPCPIDNRKGGFPCVD